MDTLLSDTADRKMSHSEGQTPPCSVLKGALDQSDIDFLKKSCREHLDSEDSIPSYVLVDKRTHPVFAKIKERVQNAMNDTVYYLNDFYIYTGGGFKADWHMDTELYTFAKSVNAWILLSPDTVESPLAFIDGVNDSPENYYHELKSEDGESKFVNYANATDKPCSLEVIEREKVEAPAVSVGDILLLDPKRFHKTNIASPKHVVVIKFVLKENGGFKSATQMPGFFWSETKLMNRLLEGASDWEDVIAGVQDELKTPEGRKILSDGFFPEKIALYKEKVKTLT